MLEVSLHASKLSNDILQLHLLLVAMFDLPNELRRGTALSNCFPD